MTTEGLRGAGSGDDGAAAISAFSSDSGTESFGKMLLHYTGNRDSGPASLIMSVMKMYLCHGFTNRFAEVNNLTHCLPYCEL